MISLSFSQYPFSTAATTAAHAPLPQAKVSPLPLRVENLDEFGVNALGEERVVLKLRSELLEVEIIKRAVEILAEHDAVRVAHGNAGNAVFLPQNRERYVDRCFSGKGAGKCRRGQHRAPHVNGDGGYRPVGEIELQPAHTAVGLHADRVSRNIACVMQVFSDVAQAVSCNLSAASVPVEDPHPAIRNRAFLQEHQPESTDPIMPVAQGDAQGFRAGDAAVKILRKDIIVSGGFHFGKAEPCAFGPHMVQIHQLRCPAARGRRLLRQWKEQP